MKDTGIKMDCVACGKPISITAKFCGKCGAPVKREESIPAEEHSTEPSAVETEVVQAVEFEHHEDAAQHQATEAVDELVFTIDLPHPTADHKTILDIDLNLQADHQPISDKPVVEAAQASKPLNSVFEHQQEATSNWVAQWEADQEVIKSLLEKHSHLLDFISLSAQQQAYIQSQPNPLEPLLKEVIQQQGQLQAKLDALQLQADRPSTEVAVKMPDEFKLLLEKQKIELQKFFSQNIAQNSSNIEAANSETINKIEAMLSAHASTTENLEKSLTPVTQTVADLKTKLQSVSKKIDDASTQSKKSNSSSSSDSTDGGGGFIIFIIGLMCGLTVVLSSLAIYNFLSHESAASAHTSHEEPPSDHGKEPAKDDHGGAASDHSAGSHDKPAADSHSKEKSH